jgi:outer membrane lipoprotein-sorting protein
MDRRAFLLSTAAIAVAGPALAQRQLTEEELTLIRNIGTHNSAIRTMVGRFLQVDTQGARIEGTFFLERPDKIRFRYNPPSREEIISVGRGFYVINRQEQTQYAYPQDRIPLRQFLTSQIDFLKSNMVDFAQRDGYATITLADDSPIGVVQVALVFDDTTLDLVQWTLIEPNGSELTFSAYDVQKDVEIPRGYFYIDPTYKAVEPGSSQS